MRLTYLLSWLSIALTLAVFSVALRAEPSITPTQWPPQITAQMRLGKALFFDTALSEDRQSNCGTCHKFDRGGSVASARSLQHNGALSARNASSIFNLNPDYKLGWLASIDSPTAQIDKLVDGGAVMGLSWAQIVERLKANTEYVSAFREVYQSQITAELVNRALVAYEIALTTPAPFDRYLNGERDAISARAQRGFSLFKRFGCIACHQGRNVGGNLIQKLGVVEDYPLLGGAVGLGRFALTQREDDRQVFRVPSLRNVAQSAPYFHDGSIAELEQAVKLMGRHQLGTELSDSDITAIVAFLNTLSGQPHPELMP
ncbi:MAG: cytochrome-c peroxidase [Pseudomonadales bacterium]